MPTARFTVFTLGVADMRAAIAFYAALGFERRLAATGQEVAFFATGASVLALYPWEKLAAGARQLKPAAPTAYGGYAGYFADPGGHVWEAVTAPGLTVDADGRLRVAA